MDWSTIIQSVIAAVISSAVVSSIVTFYLKSKSDLKKRKIVAYTDYLEQYRKIFPLRDSDLKWQIVKKEGKTTQWVLTDQEYLTWRDKKYAEILKLEKYYCLIMIIGDIKVYSHARIVQTNLVSAIQLIDKANYGAAHTCIEKAQTAYSELLVDMANEIQGKILYRVAERIQK